MLDNVTTDNLGTVFVQPTGERPPLLTLFVRETIHGMRLVDETGVQVTPRSGRLGYQGRAKVDMRHLIVCDDDVSRATRAALVANGYANVIERP